MAIVFFYHCDHCHCRCHHSGRATNASCSAFNSIFCRNESVVTPLIPFTVAWNAQQITKFSNCTKIKINSWWYCRCRRSTKSGGQCAQPKKCSVRFEKKKKYSFFFWTATLSDLISQARTQRLHTRERESGRARVSESIEDSCLPFSSFLVSVSGKFSVL